MKKLLFFLFIFIFQTYGGATLFGKTSREKIYSIFQKNINESNQSKLSDDNLNVFLLEESNIDFEDEFHDIKINNSGKITFLENHNNFLKSIQNFNSKLFVLKYRKNNFTVFSPFFGFSNPIYISIKILRI